MAPECYRPETAAFPSSMIILCWCIQWAKVYLANTALHLRFFSKIREAPGGPEPISFNMFTFPLGKMVWETSGSERHWIFLNFFLWGPAPLLPFAACSCCQEIEDRGWKALGLLGTIWQQGQWDEQLSPCTAGSHLFLTPLQYWGGRTLIFRFPELCRSLLI